MPKVVSHETIVCSEPIPQNTARRAFWLKSFFLCACAIFLVAQVPIQCLATRFLSLESANYAFVRDSIASEGGRASILCLGDSLVKLGVSPPVMEKCVREPVFNLAVIGSRPMATYCILKRVIRKGGKPKAVLVDFEPGILYADPRKAVHESSEFYDLDDCIDAGKTLGDWGYACSLMAAVLLPVYRLNYVFSDFVVGLAYPAKRLNRENVEKYIRNWQVNRGESLQAWQPDPVPSDPAAGAGVAAAWRGVIRERSPWICNQMNEIYMGKFFELAKSHSIKVYWLITPMHPAAQIEMERAGVDSSYVQFAKSFQSRFENLAIVDGRRANYDGPRFIDSAHFHKSGATVYSAALGRMLSSVSTQRWIYLPACEPATVDLSLEDVEQSAKILQAAH